MPRKPHSYHYIYKITCNITGKYYIGMHSTSNLDDGYMGSGLHIYRSLKKYGIDNHVKEVLEFLSDRSSLSDREREIVNEELLEDSLCMNIAKGGSYSSGTTGKRYTLESRKKMAEWERTLETRQRMSNAAKGVQKSDEHRKNISEAQKGTKKPWVNKSDKFRANLSARMSGKKLSEATKLKMIATMTGKKLTEEHKQNMRKPKAKIECPHCGKIGGTGAMQRHHFSNCKMNK